MLLDAVSPQARCNIVNAQENLYWKQTFPS